MLTLEALKEIIITEGIASVKREFEGAELEGSIEGFEACRKLDTPGQFEAEMVRRHDKEHKLIGADLTQDSDTDHEAYWRHRYGTIQIEFVYNILRVGWGMSPISARAGIRYHQILEQHGGESVGP